jgi:hypothetical protein
MVFRGIELIFEGSMVKEDDEEGMMVGLSPSRSSSDKGVEKQKQKNQRQ